MNDENNEKKRRPRRNGFFRRNGFYIVVFVCVAAIGVSGYILLFGENTPAEEPQSASAIWTDEDAAAQPPVRVVVNEPAPEPEPEPEPKPDAAKDALSVFAAEQPPEPIAEQTVYIEEPAEPVFVFPVSGEVINGFSLETLSYNATLGDWRVHSGVDISCEAGEEVRCIADGTVTEIYNDELLGSTVTVEHADGLVSSVSNLEDIVPVYAGQRLTAGETLGKAGHTAVCETAEGEHIHLSVMVNGVETDPVALIGDGK